MTEIRLVQPFFRASRSLLGIAALLILFAAGFGCKATDAPPPPGHKDLSMSSDDGGASDCESMKCQNENAKCCAGEPCVDTTANPLNCGDCGKVCPPREVCSNSTCLCRSGGHDEACATGSECCYDGCKQTMTDTLNCGSCNHPCKMGEACVDGKCSCGPAMTSCATGQICCSTGCSDLQNDPMNCNSCGRACPAGKGCKNGLCDGECPTACTFPQACCNGMCADLANDPLNCRACGRDCKKLGYIAICIAFICVGEKPADMGVDIDMSLPPVDMTTPPG